MAEVSGVSALSVYGVLDRLEPLRKGLVARDPAFKKELETFQARVKSIKSVEDLFKDYRVLKTILEAYGLETEIDKAGFVKNLLTGNPTDKKALIQRVNDPRYVELTADIRLYSGLNDLKSADFAKKVETRLKQIRTEKSLDEQSPGIRAAMRFKAEAARVKTAYDILGNPVLREVVLTATGLPKAIAYQSVESQARVIESRVKISKFSDPAYVDKLAKQFLVNHDREENAQNNLLLQLFNVGGLFA